MTGGLVCVSKIAPATTPLKGIPMELFNYGLQLSLMMFVVVFFVAILLQTVITLFVQVDKRLTRSVTPEVGLVPEEIILPPPFPNQELSAELIAVITAAVEAATDKRIRVKSIRYRRQKPGSSWVVQGRAAIMASHKVKP
jgi:Na+-transporting methylmalonyl-CoA/oxaloacetate decarboxylase gamma subunit